MDLAQVRVSFTSSSLHWKEEDKCANLVELEKCIQRSIPTQIPTGERERESTRTPSFRARGDLGPGVRRPVVVLAAGAEHDGLVHVGPTAIFFQ